MEPQALTGTFSIRSIEAPQSDPQILRVSLADETGNVSSTVVLVGVSLESAAELHVGQAVTVTVVPQ